MTIQLDTPPPGETPVNPAALPSPTARHERRIARAGWDDFLDLPHRPWGYLVAVVAAAVAFTLAAVLRLTAGVESYAIIIGGIIIAAWFGGWRLALLLVAVTAVLAPFIIADQPADRDSGTLVAVATVIGALASAVIGRARRHFTRSRELALERKSLLDAVVASERRLSTMANALPGLISYVDRDLRYRFNNRAYEEWFGHSAEEIAGRTLPEVLGPDAYATISQYAEAALRGEPVVYETMIPYRDGGARWVHAAYVPDVAPDGEVRGFYALVTDISERKRAEQALADSEARARGILDAAVDAVITIDEPGRIESFNPAAERLFGYAAAEVIGQNVSLLMPSPYREEHDGYLRNYYASGTARIIGIGREVTARRKDGSTFPIDLAVSEVKLGDRRLFTGIVHDLTSRVAAEQDLRSAAERSRLAEAAAHFGTWEWDLRSTVTWSRAMEEIYGFDPGAYAGTFEAFIERVHPDDRQATTDLISRAAETGEELDFEHRVVLPDGRVRWLHGRGALIRDAAGAPQRMVGIGMDITERKRAEAALREAERLAALATSAAGMGTWEVDQRTGIPSGSDQMQEILGINGPLESFEDALKLIHPGDRDTTLRSFVAAVEAGRDFSHEFRIVRPDGSVRWIAAWANPAMSAGGELRFAGLIQDITQRKRADEALRESEARYRALATAIPALIATTTPAGQIEDVSESYSAYTGLTPEQARDWERHAVIHPDDYDAAMAVWSRAIETGEDMQNEMRLRRHDGAYRWHLVQGTPVRGADGTILRWVTASIDIDDRKRAEARDRYIAEARGVLTEGLDYRQALERVLAIVVPEFADWASLYEPGDSGQIVRLATQVADERLRALADARIPIDPGADIGIAAVIRRGKPELYSLIPPEVYAAISGDAGQHLEGGEIVSAVIVPVPRRGGTRAALALASRQPGAFDDDDLHTAEQFAHAAGIALDNARLFSELRATASAQRRQAGLLAQTRDAVFMWELSEDLISGPITYWNRGAEALYGYPEKDAIGRVPHELLKTDHPQGIRHILTRLENEGQWTGELTQYTQDGRRAIVEARFALVREDDGRRIVLESARDITDRRRIEDRERFLADTTAQLVSSLDAEEILRAFARLAVPPLADICSIGVFTSGPHTARLETAGVTDDERPPVDRIHLRGWLAQPRARETVDDVIQRGKPVFIPDFTPKWIDACAPDDGQREAALALDATSVMCVPLVARGQVIGMSTFAMTRSRRRYTAQDLSLVTEVAGRASIAVDNARLFADLRETAESLRRANAAKDEFLGLVSHELKTPITTILGNAEVLQRRFEHLEPALRSEALADIRTEADRLHRIIENLLVLARLERGQQVEVEPLLMRRVVERVAEAHRRQFPFREVRLRFDDDIAPVLASPDYIEQVVRNLLSNAEKYSPSNTPIEITVGRDGSEAVVRVLDRGPGIAEDEIDSIFTPFYRSPRTAAQAQGVGIGLAVCRRLLEVQRGRMWAGRRDGGGSEFGFAVPVMESVE